MSYKTLKLTKADYKRILTSLRSRSGKMYNYYNEDKSKGKHVSLPIKREADKITNLINKIISQ